MKRRFQFSLGTLMIVVAAFGGAAALFIPSLLRNRHMSQQNACISNLIIIDLGKEQWALANNLSPGTPVDPKGPNEYIKGITTPVCPGGGRYTYNNIGSDPTCSGVTASRHALPEPW